MLQPMAFVEPEPLGDRLRHQPLLGSSRRIAEQMSFDESAARGAVEACLDVDPARGIGCGQRVHRVPFDQDTDDVAVGRLWFGSQVQCIASYVLCGHIPVNVARSGFEQVSDRGERAWRPLAGPSNRRACCVSRLPSSDAPLFQGRDRLAPTNRRNDRQFEPRDVFKRRRVLFALDAGRQRRECELLPYISRSLPAANARMTNSCVRDCECSSKTTRIVLSRTGSWNTRQIV